MIDAIACDALKQGRCLELRYDGFSRVVEVHAVGFTKENNAIMRVWQVRGGSVSGERMGWKLMRLDEIWSATILAEKSDAPRRGYNPVDPALERVTCKIPSAVARRFG